MTGTLNSDTLNLIVSQLDHDDTKSLQETNKYINQEIRISIQNNFGDIDTYNLFQKACDYAVKYLIVGNGDSILAWYDPKYDDRDKYDFSNIDNIEKVWMGFIAEFEIQDHYGENKVPFEISYIDEFSDDVETPFVMKRDKTNLKLKLPRSYKLFLEYFKTHDTKGYKMTYDCLFDSDDSRDEYSFDNDSEQDCCRVYCTTVITKNYNIAFKDAINALTQAYDAESRGEPIMEQGIFHPITQIMYNEYHTDKKYTITHNIYDWFPILNFQFSYDGPSEEYAVFMININQISDLYGYISLWYANGEDESYIEMLFKDIDDLFRSIVAWGGQRDKHCIEYMQWLETSSSKVYKVKSL